jgi:exosortase E/protease (VPEID-CTERM system)
VNTPLSGSIALAHPRLSFLQRLLIIGAALTVELLLLSGLIQSAAVVELTGGPTTHEIAHDIQHWLFRFLIAYAASYAILLYLRGMHNVGAAVANAPVRIVWLLVHAALLVPFALLSTLLYREASLPFAAIWIAWHLFGIGALLALLAALAPINAWLSALRETGALPLYSLVPAAGALLAFKASQLLWVPAAELTFNCVRILLRPLIPSLTSDPATLILTTAHFAVQVSEACSGLEGVGLMLAFCAAWLWYFRHEYVFPRALIVIPIALLLIFFLNTLRIAALVLIADAGYQSIATVGFHSQAGWIAFNVAAIGVAYFSKRSAWINRGAQRAEVTAPHDATAAYLMPLLTILAAGMIAHALSAGFDLLYPLRLVSAAAVLWIYRASYRNLAWGFSWRGVLVGVAVFTVWAVFAHFLTATAPMPEGLQQLSPAMRFAWLGARAAAAIITVPIAEELAYRGFLMRRIAGANFDAIDFKSVSFLALALSAIAFGITHGSLWLPGIVAGLAYGALAKKTGKIGESVAAHATTNALVAVQVLLFQQWQLW